jgi:hypothetical protein
LGRPWIDVRLLQYDLLGAFSNAAAKATVFISYWNPFSVTVQATLFQVDGLLLPQMDFELIDIAFPIFTKGPLII